MGAAGRVGLELGNDLAALESNVSAKGFKHLLPCKDGEGLLADPNVELFRVGVHNAKAGGFFADVDGSGSSHGWGGGDWNNYARCSAVRRCVV